MTRIKKDLKRSEKIKLLKQLHKGEISKREFVTEIMEPHSAVFIKNGNVYHLTGTNTFLMNEQEFNNHVREESYTAIMILPCKDRLEGREKAFNGKEYIDWPSPKGHE